MIAQVKKTSYDETNNVDYSPLATSYSPDGDIKNSEITSEKTAETTDVISHLIKFSKWLEKANSQNYYDNLPWYQRWFTKRDKSEALITQRGNAFDHLESLLNNHDLIGLFVSLSDYINQPKHRTYMAPYAKDLNSFLYDIGSCFYHEDSLATKIYAFSRLRDLIYHDEYNRDRQSTLSLYLGIIADEFLKLSKNVGPWDSNNNLVYNFDDSAVNYAFTWTQQIILPIIYIAKFLAQLFKPKTTDQIYFSESIPHFNEDIIKSRLKNWSDQYRAKKEEIEKNIKLNETNFSVEFIKKENINGQLIAEINTSKSINSDNAEETSATISRSYLHTLANTHFSDDDTLFCSKTILQQLNQTPQSTKQDAPLVNPGQNIIPNASYLSHDTKNSENQTNYCCPNFHKSYSMGVLPSHPPYEMEELTPFCNSKNAKDHVIKHLNLMI